MLKVGRSAITFSYRVFKQGENESRIIGRNVTVCLNMDTFEKVGIPTWFRELLEAQLNVGET